MNPQTRRRPKAGALAVLPLVAGLLLPTMEAPQATAAATTVTLGGVRVKVPDGGRQVVTVNRTAGYHARVVLWRKSHGRWERVARAKDGRIGYGGLVRSWKRRQGTGTTPLGTFGLISSFGTHPHRAGWNLAYRRIRKGDFWVEDNTSAYYNRYRNRRQGGFHWRLPESAENGSERLTDYPTQYEWAIVTSFNRQQVRHRGAGIFLHVNGSGATAGCVSAPRWFIKKVVRRLAPSYHPVIAIGR